MVLNKSIRYSICFTKYLKFGNSEKLKFRLNTRMNSTNSADSDVVLHDLINDKGILTLNRPKTLNALNFPALNIILEKLLEWENKVDMVILRGVGRAFCSGGDIVNVAHPGTDSKAFFRTKYLLDCLIGQYPVPYVSLIDGIVMGGGVGLSVHGQVRIATERTLFAMPENLIGLFPDVGVSYVLSRMPHHLGHFLGLTGYKLKGTDVVKVGIATHYTKSENIPKILKGLIDLNESKKNLNNFLLRNTEDTKYAEFSLAPHLSLIEKAFSAPTVEEIVCRLQNDGSEFALQTLNTLKKMSPISLKITKRIMDTYKDLSLEECLINDNRVVSAAIDSKVSKDLYEGARAVIDKDRNPKWNPATLEEVTHDMVDKVFGELPSQEELNFKERINQLRKNIMSKMQI